MIEKLIELEGNKIRLEKKRKSWQGRKLTRLIKRKRGIEGKKRSWKGKGLRSCRRD